MKKLNFSADLLMFAAVTVFAVLVVVAIQFNNL